MKQEHTEDTKTYAGGSLASSGDITVTAKSQDAEKGNIHAAGEMITGQNVTLSASNHITIDAGQNTQTIKDNLSSSGASIGQPLEEAWKVSMRRSPRQQIIARQP